MYAFTPEKLAYPIRIENGDTSMKDRYKSEIDDSMLFWPLDQKSGSDVI